MEVEPPSCPGRGRSGGVPADGPPLPWLFGQVGSADQCPSAPQQLTFFNSSGGSFLRAGLDGVYFLPKVTPAGSHSQNICDGLKIRRVIMLIVLLGGLFIMF